MKKGIVILITIMMILNLSVISCNSNRNNNNKQNIIELSNEYHTLKLKLDENLDNIEECSVIDDTNLLLAIRDKDSPNLRAYISDNSLSVLRELVIDDYLSYNEVYEIKGSGDGRIIVFYSEISTNSDENDNTYVYKIAEFNIDGTKTSETELDLNEYIEENDLISEITIWCNQFIFKCLGHSETTFLVTNRNGKIVGELEYKLSNYIQSVCALNDGRLVAFGQKGNTPVLSFYNKENMSVSDTVILNELANDNIYTVIRGYGDIACYLASDNAIYGLNTESKITETIRISSITDYKLNAIVPQNNKEYIIIGRHNSENQTSSVYRLTQLSDSEKNNTKVITIASLGNSTDISDMINEYNKNHDSIKIKIIDYDNNLNAVENRLNGIDDLQFKNDIIAGKTPDMLFSNNRSDIVQMSNKELFADIYNYLDNDEEVTRDSIMSNVLEACEINGKLTSISPYFSITTIAAKKKWIDKENWTIDDAIEMYESMPDNMSFMCSDSREELAEIIIHAAADCIDTEHGKCDFNNSEFNKLMKFADKFKPFSSDDYVQDSDNNDSTMNYLNDKTLLSPVILYDFRDYITDKALVWGKDDICFVGFPSKDNKGANLELSMNFSIFENSENKDICWEFIKSAFKERELDELLDIDKFPSGKANFNKLADDITQAANYENNHVFSNFTEKEKNAYISYISKVNYDKMDFSVEIMSIISDEMILWINGSNTSDEFIEALQNRISIVISEQS